MTSLRGVLYWDSSPFLMHTQSGGGGVMGRNGTYQQICAETEGDGLDLYVDSLSGPAWVCDCSSSVKCGQRLVDVKMDCSVLISITLSSLCSETSSVTLC